MLLSKIRSNSYLDTEMGQNINGLSVFWILSLNGLVRTYLLGGLLGSLTVTHFSKICDFYSNAEYNFVNQCFQ